MGLESAKFVSNKTNNHMAGVTISKNSKDDNNEKGRKQTLKIKYHIGMELQICLFLDSP